MLRSWRFWAYSPLVAGLLWCGAFMLEIARDGFFYDPPKAEVSRRIAEQFNVAYARWSLDHEFACPASIEELVPYLDGKNDVRDAWGNDFVMYCGGDAPTDAQGFGVVSTGKDGQLGTPDDIPSWEHRYHHCR